MKIITLPIITVLAFSAVNAQQTTTQDLKPYDQKIPGTEISFKLVPIPEGSFMIGSPETEKGRAADEGPQRNISISAFWMGAYEVTHDEFLLFFNDESFTRNSEVDAVTRPTPQYIDLSWGMGKQGGFPTNSMSQHTALMYCRWLYKKTGIFYRLPTEAEWEYACRAGATTAYPFGDNPSQLNDYAWNAANSGKKYHKIGEKKPNAWGLYDILGNVAEWTLDQYIPTYYETLKDNDRDPVAQPGPRYPKSVRGGGYTSQPEAMRSAARGKSDKSWNKRDPQIPKSIWWLTDAADVGFRVVRPVKQPTAEEIDAFFAKYLGNK
ncbi:MAG: formylglycine-generating enzyme family protein [Chitinophagaceae bacterium]|nr:formylglycine-generating enzyme family protein [Chitinophagaceae bacterium]